MVIIKEAKRQQEEVEKDAQKNSGGPSGFQNSAAASGPNTHSISGETVEYVNENA